MAKNSLFAILLRSPWWVSALIALLPAMLSIAILQGPARWVGALAGLPFVVTGAIAARRQWRQPGAARVALTQQAVSTMSWPAFAALLEQAFQREGYTVQRGSGVVDFELDRNGRKLLVSARRWKSARTGLESLRALQAAREASEANDALYIGLGPLSDNAVPYAAQQRITIWQLTELAHALRGLPLKT